MLVGPERVIKKSGQTKMVLYGTEYRIITTVKGASPLMIPIIGGILMEPWFPYTFAQSRIGSKRGITSSSKGGISSSTQHIS